MISIKEAQKLRKEIKHGAIDFVDKMLGEFIELIDGCKKYNWDSDGRRWIDSEKLKQKIRLGA